MDIYILLTLWISLRRDLLAVSQEVGTLPGLSGLQWCVS
ncbi:hypothetical protein DSUL_80074 [Desulfovibrionales bacterium]